MVLLHQVPLLFIFLKVEQCLGINSICGDQTVLARDESYMGSDGTQ